MAEKEFTLVTNLRAARPRSKRLRELGVTGNTGGSTVVNVSGGDVVTPGDGHTHANKPSLDSITTDSNGYEWITRTVERADEESGETYHEDVTEKVKAGYADEAYDLSANSPANARFLSKIADDVAAGRITFQQGLTAVGVAVFGSAAQFGDFVSGLCN